MNASQNQFSSEGAPVGKITLPAFSGTRIMMLPFLLEEPDSVPPMLEHYRPVIAGMVDMSPQRQGVAYLTIDEKHVPAGHSQRRAGLHIDGVYRGGPGAWGGGSGPWGGQGMLTVSNPMGCRAWLQDFEGQPGDEGECDHLISQTRSSAEHVLAAEVVYSVGSHCVHESLLQRYAVNRQLMRLSMPSEGPWFEGYTENPLGVLPPVPILPRRSFMDQ